MKRWSLVISDETDKALRMFLAQNGGKKGDLSCFVEDAVNSRLFYQTVENVKMRNSEHSSKEVLSAIEESYNEAR